MPAIAALCIVAVTFFNFASCTDTSSNNRAIQSEVNLRFEIKECNLCLY